MVKLKGEKLMKKFTFLLILPLFLGLVFSGCCAPKLSEVKMPPPAPVVVQPAPEPVPAPAPAPVEPTQEKG
jgi:hypothetical protein